MSRSCDTTPLMDRRRFLLTSLARAVAAPHAAMAQERGRVPRVSVLGPRTRADAAPFVDGFLRGLRERGWVDGKNTGLEYRFADGQYDRLPDRPLPASARGSRGPAQVQTVVRTCLWDTSAPSG
jgi:putative ABC transport system substrate-binding protein